MRCHVKICGVTSVADAVACVALGASAVGLNLVESSVRRIALDDARAIARSVRDAAQKAGRHVDVVGVVADRPVETLHDWMTTAELDCLQLHGSESSKDVAALLPRAYKAVRIGDATDVDRARGFPGSYLLADAKVGAALGGTGHTFDWSLVVPLARERKLTLAGGLDPSNVARAIATVRPFCVDVASGVERAPGVKDLARVAAFIEAAQRA